MDYGFTPAQHAYRMEVRSWLAANLPSGWGAWRPPEDDAGDFALRQAWERKLHAAGYLIVHWPREFGGQGLTYLHHLILNEELGRIGAPEPLNIAGLELAGPMILAAGSEAQKARLLPAIARAEEVWAQGFSEPGAGSDLASVETRAERQGDGWVINGTKIWISQASAANWFCLLARTDPTARKHLGLTVFAVPRDAPGITVSPIRQINRHAEFAEVRFENVPIPGDSHIGPVNGAWVIANQTISKERAISRMYRQAWFQFEFERIVKAATGGAIADSALRQRLGQVFARLRIHRMHNLRTIARLDAGEDIGAESSFLKIHWSETRQAIAEIGMDLLGTDALAEDAATPGDAAFQQSYFTSRADTIFAGTVQIQRNVIAERLLGLPK